MRDVLPSAATDVTGYGLLGHLSEMMDASGVGAVVRRSDVPVWERAVPLTNDGVYPGGLKSNREYPEDRVIADGVGEGDLLPFYVPQTSGGLARSGAGREGGRARSSAPWRSAASGWRVGEIVEGHGVRVTP